jgi:2,4-dienoyl-CoA reductase-like NADH-dependent reductase (Old Yellow Enzyme family)
MNATAKERYPHLLQPLALGPMTLDHRVTIPGHSMLLETADGMVGDRYRGYLVERAKGGAALVTMGSAPIDPGSLQAWPHTWIFSDDVVPGLTSAADAIHDAGSKLSIILWHGGHNLTHRMGIVPLAPSDIPSPDTGEIPKPMTVADIDRIVEAYAASARRCSDAGLDAIELQTSSNYLLGSFLSPSLNRRDDDYGGSLENRSRIVVRCLEAMRQVVRGDMAVGVRTSAEHLIPNDPDGYSVDSSLAAMELLTDRKLVDWVSLMTGSHWCFEEMISPMDYPRVQIAHQAERYRAKLDVPVIVAGRIRTPAEAEKIVATGQADAVAMARTFIADPHWMAKLQRGEEDQIRPCMSCNQGCLGAAFIGRPGTCVINPRAGREFELPAAPQSASPRTVAVVGGGPAGLEAARVAAERGHRVTLYERESVLGGAMGLAAGAPHREEMRDVLTWWAAELKRLGVEVVLQREVSDPEALGADAVVWATGAAPGLTGVWRNRPQLVGGIPGTEACAHGRDVLAGRVAVSGNVLVIDEEGSWPAVSTVEAIARETQVTGVTVTTDRLILGLPTLQGTTELGPVAKRLRQQGVSIHTGTLVKEVHDGVATTTDGRELGPFDSVVLSTGPRARPVPEGVTAIGDCVTPRSIWAAVTEGLETARSL